MKKTIIKQEYCEDIEVQIFDEECFIIQKDEIEPNETIMHTICYEQSKAREVALAIHPDLEREKEEFAIKFTEWFTKNTGRFTDDILALREGKYIEIYKRDNGK